MIYAVFSSGVGLLNDNPKLRKSFSFRLILFPLTSDVGGVQINLSFMEFSISSLAPCHCPRNSRNSGKKRAKSCKIALIFQFDLLFILTAFRMNNLEKRERK